LILQDGLSCAGVDDLRRSAEDGREVSADLAQASCSTCRRRHCRLGHATELELVLLPCEEEEALVVAVVEFRDSYGSAKGAPVVELAILSTIEGAGRARCAFCNLIAVVEPLVGV
jgi:hypothetical protein